jgi:RNA polymerase sigma-70 factor, ECF subfamily
MTDVATLTSEDFERGTERMRRELLAHCYQMLGSVQDAEDLVQETLLRAWRARDQYDESRASLRTWLYRIATNACLTALKGRSRRPLPSEISDPFEQPGEPFAAGSEIPWLQPFPDALLAGDPVSQLLSAGRLRLALMAAMQLLPPRQRAILILRDAFELPAAEVAEVLGTSATAVNSGLQRARARLADADLDEFEAGEGASAARQAVVDRYVTAFLDADLARLKALLADDARMEMPPMLNWYLGAEHYTQFLAWVFKVRGTDWQLRPAAASGQPAVAAYARAPDGGYELHTLQVFGIESGLVRRLVVYTEQAVFDAFGLPPAIPGRTR